MAEKKNFRPKIAVFGLGRIGNVHLRHIVQSSAFDIAYLIDIPSMFETIRTMIDRYSLKDTVVCSPDEIDKVLSNSTLNAVFICTTVHGRADLIIKSLNCGKHVFAEKPLALTEKEVSECYKAARANNKTLQCGFDKRFDVSIQKLYEKIRSDDLGTLRTIKLSARELPSTCTKDYILSSGGFLTDSAIHEFDLLVWLAGERPQSVFAFGHAHNPMIKECGDFDSVNVVLKFPSGLLAFIENFRGVPYGYDQRYEVLGTKGCAIIENPKESHLCLWDEKGMHSDLMWQQALTRFTDAYRKEIEHFAAVIKEETDCIVKGEDVTFVSRLCASATESLKQGKVINL